MAWDKKCNEEKSCQRYNFLSLDLYLKFCFMTQCQISRKRSPGVIPCFYARTSKRRSSEVYWRGVKYTAGIRSWLGDCWEWASPVKCRICCSGMSCLVTFGVLLQIVYLCLEGPGNNPCVYLVLLSFLSQIQMKT